MRGYIITGLMVLAIAGLFGAGFIALMQELSTVQSNVQKILENK